MQSFHIEEEGLACIAMVFYAYHMRTGAARASIFMVNEKESNIAVVVFLLQTLRTSATEGQ